MTDQLPLQIRSRRSHHKSRAGCQNCKKRRVKCDEKKPQCTKCVRHSIECDFASPASSASPDPTRRFRFRPSKYQSGSRTSSPSTQREAVSSSAASTSTAVQCDLAGSGLTGGISFADLKLYHHFVTSTYKTLADETTDHKRIWSHHVPHWGISFPSIMHLILALSALHQGHKDPASRTQSIAQADDHFTFGVRSVSAVLCLLNAENCQRIYMSAALICLVYFGRGPRRGEYLVFSDTGRSEWLVLLHGVHSIVSQNHDRIFTGVLEPIPDDSIGGVSDELQVELDEHLRQIRHVQAYIMSHVMDETSRDKFNAAIKDLLSAFEEVYKIRSAGKDGVCLMHLVIGWVYRLPMEMIALLEQKDRYALILFGYWSILLVYMRSSWLMQGWDAHVLHGVRTSLGEDQTWLAWPIQVIGSTN
ncbi:hypothetical protein AbraIFM66950_010774 [Aspergillus brasiliensis]|nr:hypothetical protein AbraIFM66950_010774 [Aspergillus brasiliensis]